MGARWLIDGYVRELARLLPLGPLARRRVLAEARAHLDDLADEAEGHGLDDRAAQLAAVDRFGEPHVVAASYASDDRRSPARPIALGAALAGLVIAGVLVALVARGAGDGAGPAPFASPPTSDPGASLPAPTDPPPAGSTFAPVTEQPALPASPPPAGARAVLVAERPPVVALAQPLSQSIAVTRGGRSILVPRHLAIRRLDPRRFPELRGRRVQLRGPAASTSAYAVSPDGRKFAAAADLGGLAVELVDLDGMRNLGSMPLGVRSGERRAGSRTWIRTISWPRADRMLVLVQTNVRPNASRIGRRQVIVLDPTTERVVRRVELRARGIAGPSVVLGDRTVLLLTRGERRSLLALDPDGYPTTHPLPASLGRRETWPELRVHAGRALVPVPGRAALVGISADLGVETIELRGDTAALSDPAWSLVGSLSSGELVAVAPTEGGVILIDPRDWTARVLDAEASGAAVAGDLVLAYARPELGAPATGKGVTAFDLAGVVHYRAVADADVVGVQVVGPYAQVTVLASGAQPWSTASLLLDVATGEPLAPLPGNGIGERDPVQLTLLPRPNVA